MSAPKNLPLKNLDQMSKKVKILFAINQMAIGGSQKFFVDKINMMNRDIFDPHILTLIPEGDRSFFEDLNLPQEKIVFIHLKSYLDISSWFKIVQFVRKERFDIVFSTLILANTVVRIAALMAGVRNILISEDNLYPGKKKIYFLADRVLSLVTKKILAVSYVTKAFLIDVGKIAPHRIRVTYAGIDPALFEAARRRRDDNRKKLGFDDGEIIIISVGRISVQKGYDMLIDTAKVLRETGASKLRFVIIGKDDTELGADLKKKVTDSGMDDVVEFWGIHKNVPELMTASDIFFLPSRWEGFCIVLAEAMAAGIPFVASDVGFVSREDRKHNGIKDGECGFIVGDYKPGLFADKISELIKSPSLRQGMGYRGSIKAKDLSIEKSIRRFEKICLELA